MLRPTPFNPAHLREWFTPERRLLISCRALDKLAGRPLGTFSRFLAQSPHYTLERGAFRDYLPFLALLGYKPPRDNP